MFVTSCKSSIAALAKREKPPACMLQRAVANMEIRNTNRKEFLLHAKQSHTHGSVL
jgi:hypothetical protein